MLKKVLWNYHAEISQPHLSTIINPSFLFLITINSDGMYVIVIQFLNFAKYKLTELLFLRIMCNSCGNNKL